VDLSPRGKFIPNTPFAKIVPKTTNAYDFGENLVCRQKSTLVSALLNSEFLRVPRTFPRLSLAQKIVAKANSFLNIVEDWAFFKIIIASVVHI